MACAARMGMQDWMRWKGEREESWNWKRGRNATRAAPPTHSCEAEDVADANARGGRMQGEPNHVDAGFAKARVAPGDVGCVGAPHEAAGRWKRGRAAQGPVQECVVRPERTSATVRYNDATGTPCRTRGRRKKTEWRRRGERPARERGNLARKWMIKNESRQRAVAPVGRVGQRTKLRHESGQRRPRDALKRKDGSRMQALGGHAKQAMAHRGVLSKVGSA